MAISDHVESTYSTAKALIRWLRFWHLCLLGVVILGVVDSRPPYGKPSAGASIATSDLVFSVMSSSTFGICLLVVAILAFSDFHSPGGYREIRLATTRRRYLAGASAYLLTVSALFCLAVPLILAVKEELLNDTAVSETELAISTASLGTLLFFALWPNLPLLWRPVSDFRTYAQGLAYIPTAMDQMLALMERTKFSPSAKARESVVEELATYGVQKGASDRYLARPLAIALEIETIRQFIQDMQGGGAGARIMKLCGAIWPSVRQMQIEDASTPGNKALKTFRAIQRGICGVITEITFARVGAKIDKLYGPALNAVELRRSRLYSRLAQAFVIINALGQSSSSSDAQRTFARAAAGVAGIVEDNAAAVLAHYRRMIAELALSQIANPQRRSEFIQNVGYDAPKELAMPFWPIVISFVVVFCGMLLPIAVARLRIKHMLEASGAPGDLADFIIIVISVMQGFIQSLSIAWAIFPKTYSNFARPSFERLPIRSYVTYAAYSYATGVFLLRAMLWAFPFMPYAKNMPKTYLIQCLLSMSYTVVTAVCVDRHLLRSGILGPRDRVRDGVIFAIVIGLVQMLQFDLFVYFELFQRQDALLPRMPAALLNIGFSSFTIITMATAFVIGLCVPVTAADAINRNSPGRQGVSAITPTSAELSRD